MHLVACSACHAQYDVTDRPERELTCHCGETIKIREQQAVDAAITRCGSCGASVADGDVTCDYCGGTIKRDQRRLGLICPECYARNAEDSHFCTGCGTAFSPQVVVDEGEAGKCPCDGTEMVVRSVSGVRVQECVNCLGMWVPGDHFDTLISMAVEAQRALPSEGLGLPERKKRVADFTTKVHYRPCPICGEVMNRRNYDKRSGVIIDICADHGVWLDADELEDIATYIAEGGLAHDKAKPKNPAVATAEAMLALERMKTEDKTKGLVATLTQTTTPMEGGIFSMGRLLQRLLGL